MTIETGSHYPIQLSTLPAGWRAGVVGDFASIIEPGFASGEHNKLGNGIPHLRPMNVDREGKLDLTVIKSVAASKDSRRVARGDVLFNNTNSPVLVGKTTVIAREGNFAFSNHMTRIRFGEDVMPAFAALQLHYLWMRGYFKYNCVKHVNQASVSSGMLGRMVPFVWAPLRDQDAIVAEIEKQFSRLDEAVANLQRGKANLKRYKASALKSAMDGELVECATKLWSVVALSRASEVQLGQQRAPVHAAATEQIPYIRAANVTWNGLDLADVKTMGFPSSDRYRLQVGDVLLAEASGSASEVGKPSMWNGEIPGACYQKTLIRIRPMPDMLLPRFVYYYFLHTSLSGQFARLAPGVGILHLTAERMLEWPIAIPPLVEQHRIVAEVDRRLSIVREVEAAVDANLKRAQMLRQAVLSKMFSNEPSVG